MERNGSSSVRDSCRMQWEMIVLRTVLVPFRQLSVKILKFLTSQVISQISNLVN